VNLSKIGTINPVLARELKERMRSPRAGIVIMVYLLLLTGILKLTNDAVVRTMSFQTPGGVGFRQPALFTGSLGRPILHTVLFFSLLLVCLIVPALTAGAIAGERERQTLLSLQVTLLTPRSIVVGKLLASLAFICLLIVATLPLLSSAFWVGGVSIGEVIKGVVMLIVTAIVLASIGLVCSAFTRGSRAATVTAYGFMFVLCVGTFAMYGVSAFNASRAGGGESPNVAWLIANPFVATADVVSGQPGTGTSLPSPFAPLQAMLNNSNVPYGVGSAQPSDFPFWILSVASFAVLTVGALWLSALRLKTPAPKL
jgi:ABC-type transport system involved in multi-copper enzyme maturation permease subunit